MEIISKLRTMPQNYTKRALFSAGLLFVLLSCKPTAEFAEDDLKKALTLYASFDEGFAADYARGDPALYTASKWDIDTGITEVTGEEGHVTRLLEGGRIGGALRFSSDWNPVIFYKGKDNLAYTQEDWAGAFSFWLRIDPVSGLERGYSDPFIVTDKNWNNSSLYVDFTEDQPRHFRFAAFSDYGIWNPDGIAWDDFPKEDQPMINISTLPFTADEWTHVVLSFHSLNSGTGEANITGYLNGEKIGVLDGHDLQLTWDVDRVLMALGRHYAGDFDDLAIFNRSLTDEEVRSLFESPLIDLF